jgi:predicted lipid-binding transport protein (Tim44 family)
VTSRRTLALLAGVLIALGPALAPDLAPAAGQKRSSGAAGANESRIGGRGFGSRRPTFGSRRPSVRRPAARRPIRRRPLFRHGFFGSVLRALGIAYLVHLLFGWGAGGGSPFGLLLVLGVVVWLATRRRRRRPVYW